MSLPIIQRPFVCQLDDVARYKERVLKLDADMDLLQFKSEKDNEDEPRTTFSMKGTTTNGLHLIQYDNNYGNKEKKFLVNLILIFAWQVGKLISPCKFYNLRRLELN